MDKNRKRGLRRSKTRSKILKRAREIYHNRQKGTSWILPDGTVEKASVNGLTETTWAQVGAVCSKMCCGNPRKNCGYKTRKEELSEYDYKEQINELANE